LKAVDREEREKGRETKMVTLEKRERRRERSTGKGKGKMPEMGKGVEREMVRTRGRVRGNGVKRGTS